MCSLWSWVQRWYLSSGCWVSPRLLSDRQKRWLVFVLWRSLMMVRRRQRLCSVLPLQSNEKFQVILRQEDVTLGEAMSPSQLVPYELPLMWQLYPKDRYRSCDSMYWQILYHIKASTAFPKDRVGDLE